MTNLDEFITHLDTATDPSELEPNEESVETIFSMIFNLKIDGNDALNAILVKIRNKNPHTSLYAIQILDRVFDECGPTIYFSISSEVFIKNLKMTYDNLKNLKLKKKLESIIILWCKKLKNLSKPIGPIQEILDQISKDNDSTCANNNDKSLTNKEVTEKNLEDDLSEKQNKFKEELLKITEERYLKYCKENNIEPANDANDNEASSNPINIASGQDNEVQSSSTSKILKLRKNCINEETLYDTNVLKKSLPSEMKKIKESKSHISVALEEYKKSKKEENNVSNSHQLELKQCQGISNGCEHCKKNKKKPEEEIVIPKKLPKEMQKIKDSRALLKQEVKEYKEFNMRGYHSKKLTPGCTFRNNYKSESPSTKKISKTVGQREEDRDLQLALRLSLEPSNGLEFYDSEEDEEEDEEDNASTQNFSSSRPSNFKRDRPNLVKPSSFAKNNEKEECCICLRKKKLLRRFKPCNHRVICNDCFPSYVSKTCPYCRGYYTSISSC